MIEPYYDEDGITIYNADCRDVLPQLEPVDLVLTDPPYGIGIAANPFRQKYAKLEWDSQPPDAAVFDVIMAKSSHQVIWGGNYFPLPPSQGFFIWDKCQPEDFSSAMCEMAWTNRQAPAKLFRYRVTGYYKEHPTEKPVSLMRWCAGFFPEAKTIFDPFMGSGTTLRAAKDMGLKAVGIEIEKKYCDIAIERLRQRSLLPAMA